MTKPTCTIMETKAVEGTVVALLEVPVELGHEVLVLFLSLGGHYAVLEQSLRVFAAIMTKNTIQQSAI